MPSEDVEDARAVPPAALDALRARLAGSAVVPGDPTYAATSAIWNRAHQRRPAVVVRCTRTADVAAAVAFAREQELPLTVRAGGYSPAGMCSGSGVVVDLRPMHRVRVDPLGRVAIVSAGATWNAVDVATQQFGFAVPGVPVGQIGVAGSTIGGGFGHLRRAYGLACDSMIAADLVTADGELISTSGDRSPELLWGLRGGGGNFGVATSLRFRLSPLPEPVLSGTVTYPAAHADSLLRFYRDYTSDVREDVTTRLSLRGPAAAGVGHADATVSITAVSVGHPEDAERYVDPLRHAAPMLTDGLAPRPYARLHDGPGEAYPSGRYAAMTSGYLDELDAEVIEALCGAQAAMPPGSCELQLHHMGGAVGRVARMSTAVPNRAARFVVSALARWLRPHEEAENRDWLAAADKQIRQFALGGPYVGLQSEPASSVEVYGAERYLRLAALKRRYDPDNVFNGNQNVAPLA